MIGSSSNSSWPNSTGSALPTWILRTIASTSDLTSFISFIASRMQSVSPAATASPFSTNAAAPAPARGRRCRPSGSRRARVASSRGATGLRRPRRTGRAPARRRQVRRLGGAAHADAHAVLLDRDLADAGLLDDPDDLANALLRAAWSTPPAASDSSPPERSRIARRSGSASSPKSASSSSSSSLDREPVGLVAQRVEVDRRLGLAAEVLDCARQGGVDRARASGRTGPLTRSRSSSTIVEYRFAVSTFRSACEATICPIGAASGGEPTSSRTRPTSSITSSRRSPAACDRSCTSSAATRPTGSLCWAARTATRGGSGETGSSPMCSSTRSDASQSFCRSIAGVETDARRAPARRDSAETRCIVSATG